MRDALIGVLYIVVIAGLVALSIAIYDHAFSSYTDVTVSASGNVGTALQKGSDVKVRGVLVGQVSSLSVNDDGQQVKIHLQLDPDQASKLPHNLTAQLLPKTTFGEQYVSLVLPTQAEGHLSGGQTIYQDPTPVTAQLNKLFTDFYQVLTAVQPEKLSATLGEMALSLRGSSADDLASVIKIVGSYLGQFAPHTRQFTDDLKAFATTAKTYKQAAPDLIDALDTASTVSQTLVKQQQDYQNLLGSLTTMSSTIDNFLTSRATGSADSGFPTDINIISLSQQSLPTLQIFARYSKEFPCVAQALVDYLPKANKVFGAGTKQPGGHVVLKVVKPVQPYGPGDTPTAYTGDPGPSCPFTGPSSLANTALAYVPGSAGGTTPGVPNTAAAQGMGTANSPAENELIAELVAPTVGMTPANFPQWSSLLLGPALRGEEVTVK